MGGDGIEFALPDGADVDGEVGAVGRCAERWGGGIDGVGIGAVGHALPLGKEEIGWEEGVEQTGRVRDGTDRRGERSGEGEVVGVAVCAIGAERKDDVGADVADG